VTSAGEDENQSQRFASLPGWLRPLAELAVDVRPEQLSRFVPPDEGGRESAVLILFADDGRGWDGADVLLIERAHDMRSHAGQVAFPGGAVDPGDDGPVDAALREAVEETGLDRAGVQVLATLPALFLPPSGFVVTPVLGWWREPSAVAVVDPREVASVHRVPLAELLDPANRYRVSHPSGYVGPAFDAAGLLVWGFTAGLLDQLLRLAGWERSWDAADVRELPPDVVASAEADRARMAERDSGGR
jgi:8-oxo-dGTP pyrophosphatase MutT (NUDIX family)